MRGSCGHGSNLCLILAHRGVAWEMSIGFTGSIEADGIGGSPVPWPAEGGLARCREDELWPPRVFAIATA